MISEKEEIIMTQNLTKRKSFQETNKLIRIDFFKL